MKKLFYFKLACTGIRKNRRLYLPYVLACTGMVAMSHIMQSLSYAPALREMKGGNMMEIILSLGKFVIAAFAALFLIYTNSFLIRNRYHEFGLYHVLGMGKRALSRVIFWENGIVAAISLTVGIAMGSLLYKLAELILVNMVHGQIDYSIVLDPESIGVTLTIFGVIFVLLLLRSLIQVRIANPLELLRSENVGEKPIKVKFLPGIAGAILLAAAYCIAIMTAGTFEAATWFFAAVIMVIAGTYLVMISGSVALCGLLKKWKNFYYKKQNFISVSSMAYRMKRNGAGLASICILATMVLVMISSTGSLYIGAEDALMTRYPYDISFGIALQSPEQADDDCMDRLLGVFQAVYEENEITPSDEVYYFYASAAVHMTDENAKIGYTSTMALSQMYNLMFVREEDYNRVFGTDLCLQSGQAMIGTHNCTYGSDYMSIENTELKIVGELPTELIAADMTASVYPTITLVVPELPNLDSLAVYFYYCADYDLSEEKITEAFSALLNSLPEKLKTEDGTFICAGECRANARQSFYSLFGGLFFIGVILSLIFAAAAALIIYYKQVSEGYEDRHRFAIMQHVGMTREDIKKSIRSQILMVFFSPLLLAGIHLMFAFPMIWQMLKMFDLYNRQLVVWAHIAAYLAFCVFYIIVYNLTAHAYYRIVSGEREE